MDKIVKKFSSFDDADKEDLDYYNQLDYSQRIQILLALIYTRLPEDAQTTQRLERVYRIVKLGES